MQRETAVGRLGAFACRLTALFKGPTREDVADNEPDHIQAAQLCIKSGRLSDAEAILEEGLRRQPTNLSLLLLRANLCLTQKRWDVAICYARAAIEAGAGEAPVDAHIYLVAGLRNLRRFDEADAELAHACSAFSDQPSLLRLRRAHAEIAMARTDWPEAVRRWQAALDADGDDHARVRLARVLAAVKRPEDAEHVLLSALAPDHIEVLSARAELAARQGQWDKAAPLYARVLEAAAARAPLAAFVAASLARRHLGEAQAGDSILHEGIVLHTDKIRLWRGAGALAEVTPEVMKADEAAASIKAVAAELMDAEIVSIHSERFVGGRGNNGCFIHTVRTVGGVEAKAFEKWPMNTKVRGRKLQEANFYVKVFPALDARRRALAARPWLVAEFGPDAMIVTDFIEGEMAPGHAPPKDVLESVARGVAAFSTNAVPVEDVAEIGPISDGDLHELRHAAPRDILSDAQFEVLCADVSRINRAVRRPEQMLLCHNDLNWGNVIFSRVGNELRPTFIDWGRCARNVVGADLIYYLPGGVRDYPEEMFAAVVAAYVEAMKQEGRAVSREEAIAGARYSGLQWSIERTTRSRDVKDVRFMLAQHQWLASMC